MKTSFVDERTCNSTLGFGLCPNGQCYELIKKCDGVPDCADGFDEVVCKCLMIKSALFYTFLYSLHIYGDLILININILMICTLLLL